MINFTPLKAALISWLVVISVPHSGYCPANKMDFWTWSCEAQATDAGVAVTSEDYNPRHLSDSLLITCYASQTLLNKPQHLDDDGEG